MSSLLVKEPSDELHEWLREEARYNRRSINQQILICLEWHMRTYGDPRMRNPFGDVQRITTVTPKLRGAFGQYANASLREAEKHAWRKTAETRHAGTD